MKRIQQGFKCDCGRFLKIDLAELPDLTAWKKDSATPITCPRCNQLWQVTIPKWRIEKWKE